MSLSSDNSSENSTETEKKNDLITIRITCDDKSVIGARVNREYLKSLEYFKDPAITKYEIKDFPKISQERFNTWLIFRKKPETTEKLVLDASHQYIAQFFDDVEFENYLFGKITFDDISSSQESLNVFEKLDMITLRTYFGRYVTMCVGKVYKNRCGWCPGCGNQRRKQRKKDGDAGFSSVVFFNDTTSTRCMFPQYNGDHGKEYNLFTNRMERFVNTNKSVASIFWNNFCDTEEKRADLIDFLDVPKRKQNGFIKSNTLNDMIEYVLTQKRLYASEHDRFFKYKQCDPDVWEKIKKNNYRKDNLLEGDRNLIEIAKRENAKEILIKNFQENDRKKSNEENYSFYRSDGYMKTMDLLREAPDDSKKHVIRYYNDPRDQEVNLLDFVKK
jgi:hypothetical protein